MLKGCGESRSPSDEVRKRTSGLKGEFEPAQCRKGAARAARRTQTVGNTQTA